jgi:hypothetical protein
VLAYSILMHDNSRPGKPSGGQMTKHHCAVERKNAIMEWLT